MPSLRPEVPGDPGNSKGAEEIKRCKNSLKKKKVAQFCGCFILSRTLTCYVIVAGYVGQEGFLDFGFYKSLIGLAYFTFLLYATALSVMVLSR